MNGQIERWMIVRDNFLYEGRPESETMSQSQLHVSVRNHRRKLGYGRYQC